MGLYKRGETWWIDYTRPDGARVRRSSQTTDKRQAQELFDKLKSESWREVKLGEKPQRTWGEAVTRRLAEAQKRSLEDDRAALRWVAQRWADDLPLVKIDRDRLDALVAAKKATGASNATCNRLISAVLVILRTAWRDWGWLDAVPPVRRLQEPKLRIRWLTREQADRLLGVLPQHLRDLAEFTLNTGLRESNVTGLKWADVDLERRVAWVHSDASKTGRALGVPLNSDAMAILRRLQGVHAESVFTYRGAPIGVANHTAWKNALSKAGITNFRWHDLRHTWASWHVQAGTPLHVLKELGGWSSMDMVLRYAHLSSEHLAEAAARLAGPRPVAGSRRAAEFN